MVRQRRRGLAVLVLGCWALVVAWHVRREYFKAESVRIADGARGLGSGSYSYLVRLDREVIGFASSRLMAVDGGFVLEDLLTVEVPVGGRHQRAVSRSVVSLDPALRLQRFTFGLDSEFGRFSVVGVARGDSLLELEVDAGAGREHSVVRLEAGTVPPGAVPLRLASAGFLAPGRTARARVFDPSVLASRELDVTVKERGVLVVPDSASYDEASGRWRPASYDTIDAWLVEERFGGVRLESWVDRDGMLIRARSPLGFTLERTPYELARVAWEGRAEGRHVATDYGPIIESTAIASNVALDDGAEPGLLAVRLLGVELEGLDLAGGRQRLRGDTLFVVREEPARLAPGYRLPYRGGGVPAGELSATPLIQSADDRIVATARRILAGTMDPVEAARRLNDWVYGALAKELSLSLPSAVQVLDAGRGDCNEHTVLYVALARAIGLPARTAVGLVHLNGRFYYHAWPEVWLGEWVAVDPTLGQFPAGAAHLRVLVGGLARQIELVRLIGRLRLEVL